jgi:hypothetical protein
MVWYTLQQRVFLYVTLEKYGSVRSVGENFVMKEFPADKQLTFW